MPLGKQLEIHLTHLESANDLVKFVERSPDHLIRFSDAGDIYRITVEKARDGNNNSKGG